MGLSYNGVSLNANPSGGGSSISVDSTYQSTTGSGSNNPSGFNSNDKSGGGFDWGDLINILPGLANGTANIIAATKSGQPVYYANNSAYQQPVSSGIPGWLWIVFGLVGIGLIYLLVRGGKTTGKA